MFPFENLSKIKTVLDGEPRLPTIEEWLAHAATKPIGGTCYILNMHIYDLLKTLGYHARLLRVGESHTGIDVDGLDDQSSIHYVDVGAAAAFFDPIPLTNKTRDVQFADLRFHIAPQAGNHYLFTRFRKDVETGPKWLFDKTDHANPTDYANVIADSFKTDAPFMKVLRYQIWQPEQDRLVSLHNASVSTRSRDGRFETQSATSFHELERLTQQAFGFSLPYLEEGVQWMEQQQNNDFFKTTS